MTDRELRERLGRMLEIDDAGAQERAWEVVRAVYAQTPASRRVHRPRRLAGLAVAAVVAATTITLASAAAPRHAVTRWLRQAVGESAVPRAHATLAGLPGGGQLLIDSKLGPWIVHPDGSRRYLGHYTAASWSPHALFVVAWHGPELVAVDPRGRARWALGRAGPVAVARWSPDGYRIAYIAGGGLRVVAGDGTGDRLLRAGVRPIAPAWRSNVGAAHILAYVAHNGELEVRAADTGALLWKARSASRPTQLLWSADGGRLLVVAAHELTVYGASGTRLAEEVDRGTSNGATATARSGSAFVVVRQQPMSAGDSVVLLSATADGLRRRGRVLFSSAARLTDVAWSPDGRALLVASPTADQWIFVRTSGALTAISQVASLFDPGGKPPSAFPAVAGWQPP